MVDSVAGGTPPGTSDRLEVGTRVDVRSRYIGEWTRGFEIAEILTDGVRVRRLSDGSVLGDLFEPDEVRPERRRQGLWWA